MADESETKPDEMKTEGTKPEETKPDDTESLLKDGEKKPEEKKEDKGDESLLKKDEEKKEEKKEEQKAPEAYEPFKLPEGVEIDEAGMTQAQELFKEFNLGQEQAQKLVDLYVANTQASMEAAEKQNLDAWKDLRSEWTKAVKADKEIGGDKLPEVTATISKALDTFGTPEVRKALELTGADNNPEVMKTLYTMASKLVESGLIKGDTPGEKPKTLAERFYPNATQE